MHGVAELLRDGSLGSIRPQVGVIRLVTVGAPIAFECAAVGVEHDYALVAVAVRDVDFVGLRVDENLGGQAQVGSVVAAVALSRLADLHQEFAFLRELHDHAVVIERGATGTASGGCSGLLFGGRSATSGYRRSSAATATRRVLVR